MKLRLKVIGLILAGAIGWGWLSPARADWRWLPVFDLHLDGSASALRAQYPTVTADVYGNTPAALQQAQALNFDAYFAPNFSPDLPGLWITPAVSIEFANTDQLLTIDDETFYYLRHLTLLGQLGVNYDLAEHWLVKLKGFAQMEDASQNAVDPIDHGVFSFRDAGAWGEFGGQWLEDVPLETRVGAKFFSRTYPYYANPYFYSYYQRAIAPWPANLPADLHQYDAAYQQVWLSNEAALSAEQLKLRLEIRARWVNYAVMPVFLANGQFSSDLRRDRFWDVRLELPWKPAENQDLKLSYDLRLRTSNQGFYDAYYRPIPTAPRGIFLADYYNYRQHQLKLTYELPLPLDLGEYPLQATLNSGWQYRQYLTRPSLQATAAQPKFGEYQFGDPHWENNWDLGLKLKRNFFAKWFSVYLTYDMTWQYSNSNIEDNPYYTYNFTYQMLLLGTELSF